jgi:hypothetical protein
MEQVKQNGVAETVTRAVETVTITEQTTRVAEAVTAVPVPVPLVASTNDVPPAAAPGSLPAPVAAALPPAPVPAAPSGKRGKTKAAAVEQSVKSEDAALPAPVMDAAAGVAEKKDEGSGWPPPLYITRAASESEVYYMKHRWQTQWLYYDGKATENKRKYQSLQVFIGVGSVMVPVLLTASSALPLLTIAASVLSVGVAAAAAIENVKKYGENWRSYRKAAEDLVREKSLYDTGAGPYRIAKRPFMRFVERSEDIMAEQNGQFAQRAEDPTLTQQSQSATPTSAAYTAPAVMPVPPRPGDPNP